MSGTEIVSRDTKTHTPALRGLIVLKRRQMCQQTVTMEYKMCHLLGQLLQNSIHKSLINNRNLFVTVPETGESKIKAPVDPVSGENDLPGSQTAIFPLCPHVAGRRGRELSEAFFIRARILFTKAPPSQSPHLLIALPWCLGWQLTNSEGTETFSQSQILSKYIR